jgi:uncharacterized protein (DUF2249 family)
MKRTPMEGPMIVANAVSTLDIRMMNPFVRPPLISGAYRKLGRGEAFELISGSDPRPLRNLFEPELDGQFAWQYLETGPEVWRVSISKTD